jgi:hypothetical protein
MRTLTKTVLAALIVVLAATLIGCGSTTGPSEPTGNDAAHEHDHANGGNDHAHAGDGNAPEPVALNNDTCPILGNPANPHVSGVHNGYAVNFCCLGCKSKFDQDPEAYADEIVELTGTDIRKPAGE